MASAATESKRRTVRLRSFQAVFATAGAWGLVVGLVVVGLLAAVGLITEDISSSLGVGDTSGYRRLVGQPVTLPIGDTALRLTTHLGEKIMLDASTREAPKVCQLLASFERLPAETFEC
jgi:hypothetical protein